MTSTDSENNSLSGGIIEGMLPSPMYFWGKVEMQFLPIPNLYDTKYFLYLSEISDMVKSHHFASSYTFSGYCSNFESSYVHYVLIVFREAI